MWIHISTRITNEQSHLYLFVMQIISDLLHMWPEMSHEEVENQFLGFAHPDMFEISFQMLFGM